MKVKEEKKSHILSLFSKMFLVMRGLLVLSTKIVCWVSFFVPFLGLFDVLQHLKAERLPLDSDLYIRMISSDSSFFDHATITDGITDGISSKVATQDINFGMLIKIPQNIELDLP